MTADDSIALASATVDKLNAIGISSENQSYVPREIFDLSNSDNLILSILLLSIGGFLVGFGTRYAGGCTSGHAITGLSQLQVGSLIAVIGFFIGGLVVTHFIYPIYLLIMKKLYFLFWGVIFGIVLIKSEVASWFRIYEMFQFDSFHMYGVIGSAVIFGIILTQVIKRMKIKSIDKQDLVFVDKDFMPKRYIFGGIIFGLGWGLNRGLSGANVCLVGRKGTMPLSFPFFSPY